MMMMRRRCSTSAVSLTDMIMSNIEIRRSHSMLSLPQALASANLEHLLHQSQPSLSKSSQILQTKKERCDPLCTLACSSVDEKREKDKRRRSKRRSRRRKSQVSIMATNGDGPHEGRQTLENKRSLHSKASNGTLQSRETLAKRRRGAIIKRTDTMTRLARKEPIPRWINLEIKVLPGTSTPSRAPQVPVKKPVMPLHKDLVPLSDLAMILSRNLDTAIAKGLYAPEMKLTKTMFDAGTLSTTMSSSVLASTVLSSLHASLGDVAFDLILADYEC